MKGCSAQLGALGRFILKARLAREVSGADVASGVDPFSGELPGSNSSMSRSCWGITKSQLHTEDQ